MCTPLSRRRGSVTILVAICLIALLGFVALSVDGGLLLDDRQKVQSAADTAALAAADQLYLYYRTNQGLDSNSAAANAAKAAAKASGFTNVTVNVPPQSGTFSGLPGYAEVIVKYSQKRYFSTIFGSSDVPVTARAVAYGYWGPFKVGVMVLNPTASGALTTTGSGTVNVAGVPTIVDSNSPTAVTGTGGGASLTSSEFDITGVPGTSGGGTYNGTVYNGQPPIPDPLAYLPAPDPSTLTLQSKNQTHISGNGNTTLYPGVYNDGITISGQGNVTLMPGIYYMNGGGFSITGQGGVTANGVMIYNAPQSSSDVINLSGTGAMVMSPPTSGTYQGISLFQARGSTNTMYVTGNGFDTITGTFYTANGTLNVSGNGAQDVIGSQYISNQLVVNGNGAFTVSWDADNTARTRIIRLVE